MGSRPKLLISRLFWGGLGREVHPNSSYCRSVTLENRAWTLAEPDGGKFLSPGMKAKGRTRFGSHLQGLFLFFIHIKEKNVVIFHPLPGQGILKHSLILNYFYIVKQSM